MVRRLVAMAALVAVVIAGFVTSGPARASGGELVIIDNVIVGNPVMNTESECTGYVEHNAPVIPVTVIATFIPSPGEEPTGPYAVAGWSGGFGSSDDHFGTGQAKATTQDFHILLRPDSLGDYHGQGHYTVWVTVQDVGLAGGIASEAGIPVDLPPFPPSSATAEVKCAMADGTATGNLLSDIAQGAAEHIGEAVCAACSTVYEAVKNLLTYNDILDHYLGDIAEHDPPDDDYQQVAQPVPPPILAVPTGLSAAQQSAVGNLERGLAAAIGQTRAVFTTLNRVWGADNATDRYWFHRQLAALHDSAAQAGTALAALPALWAAAQAALAPSLPAFTVDAKDVYAAMLATLHGFADGRGALFTQLGASPSAQHTIAQDLTTIDPARVPAASDGVGALFGQDAAGQAAAFRRLAAWAAGTTEQAPPVVASVSPAHIPISGGVPVTVTGTNLASVTGLNFGPSSPTGGQGLNLNCSESSCTALAPPGTGTVDVTAVGPGGPSDPVAGDRLSYVVPATPQVTHVFPADGPMTGQTVVSILGSGLAGGTVYFGPTTAGQWQCTDTKCTAYSPTSAQPITDDITVVTASGTSAISAADRFTYLTGPAPAAVLPVVGAVSPSHGSDLGGEQVTVTGSHFRGVTAVDFAGSSGFASRARAFTVLDDSHLVVTAPPNDPGAADVRVYNPAGESAVATGDRYTFDPKAAPHIAAVTPSSGPDTGGTAVTITGTDLGGDSAMVMFGQTMDGSAVCSSTTCTATAPPGADGPVDVSVWSNDGESATTTADRFTYTAGPKPAVTKIVPDSGTVDGGTHVAIFGTHLASGRVTFGGHTATDVTCTESSCVATAPAGAVGPAHVAVTTFAGISAATAADVYGYARLATPVIDSIDPPWGFLAGGAQVEIRGHDLTNGSVLFGSKADWGHTCTQTVCTATAPDVATGGPVDVRVKTPAGTSATTTADLFTYLAPTVTKISPARGWTVGGDTVTVTGTHLLGGSVSFGTKLASGSCTDTTCTVVAPKGVAGTVDVTVQGNGITRSAPTAADRFTYAVRPAPSVSAISPATGTRLGGTPVTVTGTDLDGGTVKFGANTAKGSCTATTCTVTSPGHTAGAADVTVTTTGGTSPVVTADAFTYVNPAAPTITALAPDHATAAGGTVVTIKGTDLTNGSVRFGTVAATSVSCTADTCTATSPGGVAGPVDVRVTATAGVSAVSAADRFTYVIPPAPTITRLTPAGGPMTGGTTVHLYGTDLHGAGVTFGGVAASSVTCREIICTLVAPPGAVGPADVRVTTLGGTSGADHFTYSRIAITEHAIPGVTKATGGGMIVRGIGGDLWFTMPNLDLIGRVGSDGAITTYPTAAGSMPVGLTLGPDGRMWFTEEKANTIVAIDGSGNQTAYSTPGMAADIRFITAGPDGRLWFTLADSGSVGAITTAGGVTIYHLPDPSVIPYNIITGADDRLWFTEENGNSIGAITTSGVTTEYPLPDPGAQSWGISRGPDDRIWLAEEATGLIAAVTTDGQVTDYPLPPPDIDPEGLTYGPDGRMWFTDPNTDEVSALDPASGAVTDYALPGGPLTDEPRYLALAGDGSLWATEFGGSKILRVDGVTSTVAPTVSSLSPDTGPTAGGTTVTLTGTNLGTADAVTFGSTPATAVTVLDAGHVQAVAPPGSGVVDVRITTPDGQSPAVAADRFGYGVAPASPPRVTGVSPAAGSTTGGTTITVRGTGLEGGSVAVGPTAASAASCTATACTATAPAGAVGTVDVHVTTAGGTSAASDADGFTYLAPRPPAPVVTAVSPATGPLAGGTAVTVRGTGLAGGIVTFGLDRASATCTATSCSATAPRGAAGFVDVRVETAGGRSTPVAADRFTYAAAPPPPPAAHRSALSIAAASPVRYGTAMAITARLTDAVTARPVTGAIVNLYQRATARSAWSKVGTATVASTGSATRTVRPHATAQYQWRYAGTATHLAATSPTRTVTVVPIVSARATASRVKHGTTVKIYGTVQPGTVGAPVWLQRLSGHRWVTAGKVALRRQKLPNGATAVGYVLAVRAVRGTTSYRVYRPATAALAAGWSGRVVVRAS